MIFKKIRERLQKQVERYQESLEGQHCIDYRWIDEEGLQATEEAIDIINQVETEYNNGWIPCSERLPETYGDYLCCDNYGEYIIGFPNKRDSNDDDYVEYYVETEHEIMNDCIAWQPLPNPYIPKAEPEWQDRVMNHFTKGE